MKLYDKIKDKKIKNIEIEISLNSYAINSKFNKKDISINIDNSICCMNKNYSFIIENRLNLNDFSVYEDGKFLLLTNDELLLRIEFLKKR